MYKSGNLQQLERLSERKEKTYDMEIKQELEKKLQEFSSYSDNIEEVYENREQIEISRFYEKLPKPVLIATQEFIEHKIYYRNPLKDKIK